MAERMAVVVREGPFGSGSYVCKDEWRSGFGSYARKVDAVPCWGSRGEDAGFRTELGRCVVADSEAVACTWLQLVFMLT